MRYDQTHQRLTDSKAMRNLDYQKACDENHVRRQFCLQTRDTIACAHCLVTRCVTDAGLFHQRPAIKLSTGDCDLCLHAI